MSFRCPAVSLDFFIVMQISNDYGYHILNVKSLWLAYPQRLQPRYQPANEFKCPKYAIQRVGVRESLSANENVRKDHRTKSLLKIVWR